MLPASVLSLISDIALVMLLRLSAGSRPEVVASLWMAFGPGFAFKAVFATGLPSRDASWMH